MALMTNIMRLQSDLAGAFVSMKKLSEDLCFYDVYMTEHLVGLTQIAADKVKDKEIIETERGSVLL